MSGRQCDQLGAGRETAVRGVGQEIGRDWTRLDEIGRDWTRLDEVGRECPLWSRRRCELCGGAGSTMWTGGTEQLWWPCNILRCVGAANGIQTLCIGLRRSTWPRTRGDGVTGRKTAIVQSYNGRRAVVVVCEARGRQLTLRNVKASHMIHDHRQSQFLNTTV